MSYGCKPPPFEAAMLRTILNSTNSGRKFSVIWEKTLELNTESKYFYKAVLQLRRTFRSFMGHWLDHDFMDCFIEDFLFVDFKDDKLYIYKSNKDQAVVPLSMPLSFEAAGCMIEAYMNIE